MTIFENVIKAGNHRPNVKYFVGFDNNQYGRLLAEVKKHKDFGEIVHLYYPMLSPG
jgi:ABC-type sugar transport system substrate-binding protein